MLDNNCGLLFDKKIYRSCYRIQRGFYMSMPGLGELIVIFLILLVVFGAGRIPKIAKDLGTGIKEFKKAISGDDKNESAK